jgi:hypothetical protein
MQVCLNTWQKVALWRWQIDEFDETVTPENEEHRAENGEGQLREVHTPYEETIIY